jgi:LysM repeat protein
MAVVDIILEINHMKSPQELQVGQTLEIPWPTPTPGGQSTTAGTGGGGDLPATEAAPQVRLNEFGTPDLLATYQTAEPTLRPGQAWHTVQSGETILSIAIDYDTTIEVLSQINPEVPFLQCDFGSPSGGPNCSVMLSIGQRVRVPVPLPTLTLTPSPAGTLTPTPTATPTFNAPYLLSPQDNAHFRADEMVTLRWGGTGTLAEGERYTVHVHDLNTGATYEAAVTETTYILPGGWQPSDGNRHTFEWTISVATVDAQNNILSEGHETDSWRFVWDSR